MQNKFTNHTTEGQTQVTKIGAINPDRNGTVINHIKDVKFDFSTFPQQEQPKGDITPTDILNEVETTQKRFCATPHKDVLKALLTKVVRIDFRELVGVVCRMDTMKSKTNPVQTKLPNKRY